MPLERVRTGTLMTASVVCLTPVKPNAHQGVVRVTKSVVDALPPCALFGDDRLSSLLVALMDTPGIVSAEEYVPADHAKPVTGVLMPNGEPAYSVLIDWQPLVGRYEVWEHLSDTWTVFAAPANHTVPAGKTVEELLYGV